MTRKSVLVGPIHETALEQLAEGARVVELQTNDLDEYLSLLPTVHGVILGGQPMGAAELDLGTQLEIVGRHGVGYDAVDVPAATERGIPFVNTPYGPTESTAELALMLIIATARSLPMFDRAVRNNDFGIQRRYELLGRELDGLALGVVGYGRIGQRVAEMCEAAFRMRVHVFDPCIEPGLTLLHGRIPEGSLVEMAPKVDVLTIHCPLCDETRGLVGRDVIGAMKPGAFIVNASRGPVVDEAALVEALQDGRLAGAGIDVYDPEPPRPDNPLFQMDNVVLTPHIGSFTVEGRLRMGTTVVTDVLRALQGERPYYLVNPEVWDRRRYR
jgi:D-3-phosphoglycerate dehydrogenase